MVAKKKVTKSKKSPVYPRRGLLWALAVVPLGVVAWVFLWSYGFIASLVAWGIAGGAVWLYKYGSKGEVTRAATPWLIAIILFAVMVAFVSGLVSDLWGFYGEEVDNPEFWSNDFWTLVWNNLTYGEFLAQYWLEFFLSLAFAILGAGSIVMDLFKGKK